jgi:hypothetical protein
MAAGARNVRRRLVVPGAGGADFAFAIAIRRQQLVHQLDRIAFANHSFGENGGINTGFAFVRLRHRL